MVNHTAATVPVVAPREGVVEDTVPTVTNPDHVETR
jgi:hypothetical protein